jgi:predicted esterase
LDRNRKLETLYLAAYFFQSPTFHFYMFLFKAAPFCLFYLLVSITFAQPSTKSITAKEAVAEAEKVISDYQEKYRSTSKADWEKGKIQIGSDSLLFTVKVFGEKPSDGRSMFISLHGGGSGPASMNDQQYKNQQRLYKPAEGVYFVPRAPSNTWNMWHQEPVDGLLERAILDAVIIEGVNPNKVYVMGYSAGGDGVYQLAPRMADHWAAAAMMAGHPGDAAILNLRNLPFFLAVGEKDAAYNRNALLTEWSNRLDSLQSTDKGGFIHDAHLMAGMPHWMKQQDTISVAWMARFKRNPYPQKVNWIQDDVVRKHFYWLSVPQGSAVKGHTVFASYGGQEVDIQRNDNDTLYIHLNDKMMNLDKQITIRQNGKVLFKGKVVRRKELIQQSYADRRDADYIFSSEIVLVNGKVHSH